MADQDQPTNTSEVADEAEPKDISETLVADEHAEVADETNEEPDQGSSEPDEESGLGDEEAIDDEPKGPNALQKLWAKYKAKKKLTIPLTIVAVLAMLFAIPTTRYALAAMAVKRDVQVHVLDSTTNVPVSGVDVTIRGITAKTDGDGKATLAGVKVGHANVTMTKAYYKDFSTQTLVAITKQGSPLELKIEATGRQVPLQIKNKLTGKVLGDAKVKAAGSEAQTDDNGETTLVLPPDQATIDGEVSLDGFNKLKVKIKVDQFALKDNTFSITPAGKIYFLSKRTGKIDVMKSDLDGANPEVVLKATGKEEDYDTVLLSTRDWKYLALKSRRDSEKPKLYLIDTSNDKELIEIDGADDVRIEISGWVDHNFVYSLDREKLKEWEPKQYALKSFSAESRGITVIDESKARGNKNEHSEEAFLDIYTLNNEVVYSKRWDGDNYILKDERVTLNSFNLSTGVRKTIKDYPVKSVDYWDNYFSISPKSPKSLKIAYFEHNKKTAFFSYSNSALTEDKELNQDEFYEGEPTYLISPGGNQTLWYEERDGNNTIFLGNADGGNGKEVANLEDEYTPYGWYSDDYLLVSKKGSELYVLPSSGNTEPLKVTDYHRPSNRYYGYGGGYGGGF